MPGGGESKLYIGPDCPPRVLKANREAKFLTDVLRREWPLHDFYFSKRDATVSVGRRPCARVAAQFEAPSLVQFFDEHAADLGVCIPTTLTAVRSQDRSRGPQVTWTSYPAVPPAGAVGSVGS